MKIFSSFSPLVTMLQGVIVQLKVILFMYMIVCIFYAMMFGITGIYNPNVEGNFRNTFFVPPTEEEVYDCEYTK